MQRSLPHRQLRKLIGVNVDFTIGSLPHRQLRNITGLVDANFQRSLPHRQLRNKIRTDSPS